MRESRRIARVSRASPYIAPPVQRAARLIRHVAEGNTIGNALRGAGSEISQRLGWFEGASAREQAMPALLEAGE
jgi:hypothetical protein